MEAYCMKCKTKREIKDPEQITHSNGRDAIKGTCGTCGTKIFRMGKMPTDAPVASGSKPRSSKVKKT